MRKLLCILLALFIVLSGLHLSVSTHYCGGELAAYKISMTGQHATCGMEGEEDNSPAGYGFKSDCCKDKMAALSVDHNYTPSFTGINDIAQKVIHVFAVPVIETGSFFISNHSLLTFFRPHTVFRTSSVALDFICVFRK